MLIPTGTTPRASGTSWFAHDTVATRFGFAVIVVSPNAWSMVTGKASEDPADAAVPPSLEVSDDCAQPARATSRAAEAATDIRREARTAGLLSVKVRRA